ncbi:YbhB/YbcL family Raf kinase inhibitor-like protein [Haladaptatus sp. NG-SE-30]
MLGRRTLLRAMGGVGVGVSGCAGFRGRARVQTVTETTTRELSTGFSTPAFEDGKRIPREFTCEGQNVSPRLEIESVPDEAASLAIIVDDPDAPGGTFTHWLLWDLPADTTEIPKDVPQMEVVEDLGGARQGENDAGNIGYDGPCPPRADGPHTYRFTLYVLERRPSLGAGATKDALLDVIAGVRIGRTRFTGEFGRN